MTFKVETNVDTGDMQHGPKQGTAPEREYTKVLSIKTLGEETEGIKGGVVAFWVIEPTGPINRGDPDTLYQSFMYAENEFLKEWDPRDNLWEEQWPTQPH